jgi:hypothetical protein
MLPDVQSDRTLGYIANLRGSVVDGWRGAATQAMRAATRTRRVELRDWGLSFRDGQQAGRKFIVIGCLQAVLSSTLELAGHP